MTDEGAESLAGALYPMDRVEDLATVCARVQAPFAAADRVLEAAGLSRAALERARERWSVAILSDPTLGRRFQSAYAAPATSAAPAPTVSSKRAERGLDRSTRQTASLAALRRLRGPIMFDRVAVDRDLLMADGTRLDP